VAITEAVDEVKDFLQVAEQAAQLESVLTDIAPFLGVSSLTPEIEPEPVESFEPLSAAPPPIPAVLPNVVETVPVVESARLPEEVSSRTAKPSKAKSSATRYSGVDEPRDSRQVSGIDSIKLYLDDIGKYPLLEAADERELAQIIEAGLAAEERLENLPPGDSYSYQAQNLDRRAARAGKSAKDRFINCNLRLVVSVARRYPIPPGFELLDIIQEGNLGLEHAVDKFDWRKGFKFSTYATFWIRQAIGRAFDQKSRTIRLPGHISQAVRELTRC